MFLCVLAVRSPFSISLVALFMFVGFCQKATRAHLTRNSFSRQKKKLNFVYLNEFMIYNFSLIISFLYILVISFMKIFSIN